MNYKSNATLCSREILNLFIIKMFFLDSLNKRFARYLSCGRMLIRRKHGKVALHSPRDSQVNAITLYTFRHLEDKNHIIHGSTAPITFDRSFEYLSVNHFTWHGVAQMSVFREVCAINKMSMSNLWSPIYVLGVGTFTHNNICQVRDLIKIGTILFQTSHINFTIVYICSFIHNNLKYFDIYRPNHHNARPVGIMNLRDLQELQSNLKE
jgi:hypothetical protein